MFRAILLGMLVSSYISMASAEEEFVAHPLVVIGNNTGGTAIADEYGQSADTGATGDGTVAESGDQPAPQHVCPECPKCPPPPVETEEQALRKKEIVVAPQRVDLLRLTVRASMVEKGAFASFFSSSTNPIDADLLSEMDRHISLYPELITTAEVFNLKGMVHQRTDKTYAAVLDWLMLLANYPQSTFTADATKSLKGLAEGPLKKHGLAIKGMMEKIAQLDGDRDHRAAELLVFLGANRDVNFAAPIIAECASFLMRNRTFAETDRIEHVVAHQQMMLDDQVAVFHFSTLLGLYPESSLRADSYLSIATIQRKELKLFDRAEKNYLAVIQQHPDSDEAKVAYESLANMYDEDMRDYPNAIKTYVTITDKYKSDPIVLRGLQSLALIYLNRTKQPLQAIEAYRTLANRFSGAEALDALLKAEKIALNSLKDWQMAININDQIIADFPENAEAPKALYANAEMYDKKLMNREMAIRTYQELARRFPNDSLARDAGKRLNELLR